MTTDGSGAWVAVWHSLGSLDGTIGTDRDVLVARSTDDGATWTAPVALNTNAATDSGHDRVAQVTTDGLGAWVAVWASDDSLGDTIGTDYDILVARSTDDGATWTAPTALNTNAATDSGDDRRSQLTTDGQGNWVAVWHSDDSLGGTLSAYRDIFFSRSGDAGATWTAPAALNSNAATDSGNDNKPQVTTDGAGNWVAAWDSYFSLGLDADIVVSRSTDAGATWTAAAALNVNAATDSGNDFTVQVTTDGAGNWVTVWDSQDWLGDTIGTDADIFVSRSADAGATWTAPVPLNTNAATDSDSDYAPQVTMDGAGNWVAVWHSADSLGDTIGTDWDILVARSTDGGVTWTAPAALNTHASTDLGVDEVPQVTTDGQGAWAAVWRSTDSLGGAIGTDYDILVAHSTDGGATWTAPAALNANAVSDYGNDFRPQLTTDGLGAWVAIWSSWDSLGGTIGTDGDILVARSTDDGVTWTAPAALNTDASTDLGNDWNAQVTTDGQGAWAAVWVSDDSLGDTIGTDRDILVARSTDDGATWTAPAALNTNAASDWTADTAPQLTTDAQGTWVAAWGHEDPH